VTGWMGAVVAADAPSTTCAPDGLGDSRASVYVADGLNDDAACPAAFHAAALAATVNARRRLGHTVHAGDDHEALINADGIARGRQAHITPGNAARMTLREMREWYHTRAAALAGSVDRAPPPDLSGTVAPSQGPQVDSLPSRAAHLSALEQVAATCLPPAADATALHTWAARFNSTRVPAPDPLAHDSLRWTVKLRKGGGYRLARAAGPGVSNLGAASASGGVPASALPNDRLHPWDTDMDTGAALQRLMQRRRARKSAQRSPSPRRASLLHMLHAAGLKPDAAHAVVGKPRAGGGAAAAGDIFSADGTNPAHDDTHLMLRIVRPLPGSAADLTLATREPSTLNVAVTAVTLHDHPLFLAEDHLAAGIAAAYDGYARLMRTDNVAFYDGRLAALLAYTRLGGSGDGGELVYDFQRDSLPALLSRCSAVLHAIAQRYDAVTTVAGLMQGMVTRWQQLAALRASAGFTSSSLRLEAVPIGPAGAAGEGAPVPGLYPHLYGCARLLEVRHESERREGGGDPVRSLP